VEPLLEHIAQWSSGKYTAATSRHNLITVGAHQRVHTKFCIDVMETYMSIKYSLGGGRSRATFFQVLANQVDHILDHLTSLIHVDAKHASFVLARLKTLALELEILLSRMPIWSREER
jgi:hypothetical protein